MGLSTREADVAFADLICSDPQWLDAEFDALIAASFGEPPGAPPPVPPRVPPRPGTPPPPPPCRRLGLCFAVITGRLPGRSTAGSAHPRRIPWSAAGPPLPAPSPGVAACATAVSTGYRPATGKGGRSGNHLAEPRYTAGLPGGSPAGLMAARPGCLARTRGWILSREGRGRPGLRRHEDYLLVSRRRISAVRRHKVDFSSVVLTEAQQAFAEEVRAFLDEHLTEDVYARTRERADHFDEGLYVALGEKGWLMPRWRREDGGAGLDDVCVRILETELARRDAPIGVLGTTNLVWPAVEAHGTRACGMSSSRAWPRARSASPSATPSRTAGPTSPTPRPGRSATAMSG